MVLLKEQYGQQVVVNLLGSRGGEEVLNRAFKVILTLFLSWGWLVGGRGRGGALRLRQPCSREPRGQQGPCVSAQSQHLVYVFFLWAGAWENLFNLSTELLH